MLRWLAAFSITLTAVLAVGEVIIFSDGIRNPARPFGSYQVYSDGVLVVLGDGDTPDSGYEVPLTDAWFYYTPTNAAQTNAIVDLSGQSNDGTSSGSTEFTFIDNNTTEAPHIQGASNAGYDLDGLTNAASDYTIMAWLKTPAEGTLSTILASDTDDFRVAYGANASEVGFYDGAWKNFGAGQPEDDTWHLLTWEFDASESSAKFYLDDATTPTGTNTYTPRDAGGNVSLLAAVDFLSAFYVGEMSTIIGYTSVVSTAARTNFWHNTRTSHGLPSYALNDPQRDSLALESPYEYDSGADTSGNENHGTISGATFASANTNGYFVFDGINDIITYPDDSKDPGSENFSVSFWAYTSDLTNAAVASKRTSGGNGWVCYTSLTDGDPQFILGNGSVVLRYDCDTGIISPDTWHYFTMTRTGPTSLQVYVDGVSASGTTTDVNNVTLNGGAQFAIGRNRSTLYFDGRIDDFSYYTNTVVTLPQHGLMYTNSLSVHP